MSFSIRVFVSFIFTLILSVSIANANLYAGGLQTMLDPALSIEQQDIIISVDSIFVTYIIKNNSEINLTQSLATPSEMQIRSNDKTVELQHSQTALSNNGENISELLNNLGVPLDPITATHSIDNSPNRDNIRKKLISLKLLDKDAEYPEWSLNSFYYWRQYFPARSNITITQKFKPNMYTKQVNIKGNSNVLYMPFNALKKVYNLAVHWRLNDPVTIEKLQNSLESSKLRGIPVCHKQQHFQCLTDSDAVLTSNNNMVETKQVVYLLQSNAMSINTVKHFTMKISGSKDMTPMLCWHDKLKQSKNAFVFEANNYIPLQDLNIIFIAKNTDHNNH